MRSLSAHLRDLDQHGALPFHPACPVCVQTRASGTLATGGTLSVRTQALVTASLVAVSTAAPVTGALATEPDQEHDGIAPTAQNSAPDPSGGAEFDPGGDATKLADAEPPTPPGPVPSDADEEHGPVDPAAVANPTEPVADAGDGADSTEATAPAPPGPSPPQVASQPVGPQSTASPAPQAPPTTAPAPAPVATMEPASTTRSQPRAAQPAKRTPRPRRARQGPAAAPAARTAPSFPPAAQPVVARPAARSAAARAVRPGDETHTVRPGESLWLIAAGLLGDEATPARIAREVHRLWQLNRDRIATGDPDLLMIGTRLRLR